MSYCRWSSDNWKCDLYIYESVMGGYETHVAGKRIVGEVPTVTDILNPDDKDHIKFTESYKKQMNFLETTVRVSIGLPYDGQSFNDKTLEELLERITELRIVGI